jgi:hypothetical protein
MSNTHYGDEDPDCHDYTGSEYDEELFEIAKLTGLTPDDMRDKVAAAKYRDWLARQPK